jgi:hypothetical protein
MIKKALPMILVGVIALVCVRTMPQTGASWRNGFGEPTATIMESLLKALFPGAQFSWSPELTVQVAGNGPQLAKFSGFNIVPADDGNLNGATGLDLGDDKDDYIFKSATHHQGESRNFPLDLIVFRATQTGQILFMKKFALDPADPLAKIKSIQLPKWPIVRIAYESHFATQDSFTTIEWDAMFDTIAGSFVSRRPRGMFTTTKSGQEETDMFTISRTNPNQLLITDGLSKKSIPYQCADPCVVDGPTFLSKWSQ